MHSVTEPERRPALHHQLLLGLILIGYLAGTLHTLLTTPLHRGPDETQHLQYVRHLAEGRGLPVMRLPPAANPASQETAQPPAYYALVAALTFWSDNALVTRLAIPILERLFDAVYRLGWTYPLDAAFFDSPRDLWPQASLVSGYAARLPSLFFGLGALVVLFQMVRTLTGDVWSALAATVWLGWNINFTFFHAFVTPDALLALLAAGVLSLSLRALHRGLADRDLLWLGILLALLTLTKLNGLTLGAAAGLALIATPQPWRKRWRAVGLVGLLFVLGSGWWFARNWMLYGEPTGLRMMATIEGAKGGFDPQPLTLPRIAEMLRRGYQTFVSPPPRLFDLVAGLGFGAAGLGLASPRRRRATLFLIATIVLGIVPFVAWANAFSRGWHARLFLPVWPALAALWAIGFATLVPAQARPFVTLLLIGALSYPLVRKLDRNLYATENAYYYLPIISEQDQREWAGAPLARIGDALLLRHVEATEKPDWPDPTQRPLYVAFIWETTGGIPDRDVAFFVHLLAPDGTRITQIDTYHEVDTPPLVAWPSGWTVIHLSRLLVPVEYAGQPLTLYFGLYNKRTGERWPVWIPGDPQPRDRIEVPVTPSILPERDEADTASMSGEAERGT